MCLIKKRIVYFSSEKKALGGNILNSGWELLLRESFWEEDLPHKKNNVPVCPKEKGGDPEKEEICSRPKKSFDAEEEICPKRCGQASEKRK